MKKNSQNLVTTGVDVLSDNVSNDFGIVTSKIPFRSVEIFVRESAEKILKLLRNNFLDFTLGISIFSDGEKEIVFDSHIEEIKLKQLSGVCIQFHFHNLNSNTELHDSQNKELLSQEEDLHEIIHYAFSESKKLRHYL